MNTVLFGAFDRHNLGDLLLAQVAAREIGGEPIFAGLAARDMRPFGGPLVVPLAEAVAGGPARLIHVGGELLDCDAAQAAYMLGEPAMRWGRQAPYVAGKSALPAGSRAEFGAVGGVGLARRPASFRAEVQAALIDADGITVRDATTHAFLAANGITAGLVPDPVTRIADLFGAEICSRQPQDAPDVVLQFAAECGDDASLDAIARGLAGRRVTLFRAGAAPWHDDLEPYGRFAARSGLACRIFESLHIWDICALIASARVFVGTSLHGRIVAEAFGVPAVSLEREAGSGQKVRAYLATGSPKSEVLAPAAFAKRGLPP